MNDLSSSQEFETLVKGLDQKIISFETDFEKPQLSINDQRERGIRSLKEAFTKAGLEEKVDTQKLVVAGDYHYDIFGETSYFSLKLTQLSMLDINKGVQELGEFLRKILSIGTETAYMVSNSEPSPSWKDGLLHYFESFLRVFPGHKLSQRNILNWYSYLQIPQEKRGFSVDARAAESLAGKTIEKVLGLYNKRNICGGSVCKKESYIDVTLERISFLQTRDFCLGLYFVNAVFDEGTEDILSGIYNAQKNAGGLNEEQERAYKGILDHLTKKTDDWLKEQYSSLKGVGKDKIKVEVASIREAYIRHLEAVLSFAEGLPSLITHVDSSYMGILSQDECTSNLGSFQSFYENVKEAIHEFEAFLAPNSKGKVYMDKDRFISALKRNKIPFTCLDKKFFERLQTIKQTGSKSLGKIVELASIDVPGYTLIKKIGEGGFSDCYLAIKESGGRGRKNTEKYVIKIGVIERLSEHSHDFVRKGGGIDKFLEIEAANETLFSNRKVAGYHPVRVCHGLIEIEYKGQRRNGIRYQYIEGRTLKDVIKRKHDINKKIELLYWATRAVGFLHTNSFAKTVHRDVKEENFIVTASGEVYILDLGLSSAIPYEGDEAGRRSNMAPEQFNLSKSHKNIDERIDVYALGIMYYRTFDLYPPSIAQCFIDDKGVKKSFNQVTIPKEAIDKVVLLNSTNPEIPKDFSDIALKCINFNPKDRYKNAQKVADAFVSSGLITKGINK